MDVQIQIQNVQLNGNMAVPNSASGLIIFAHGSGSGRFSPRNKFVAEKMNGRGFATLLFDLLTEEEEKKYQTRFDIDLLTERLIGATKWCMENTEVGSNVHIGYFGVSTGSAAALSAAAYWGTKIGAVVSRGGRPDLALEELDLVEAPTLLIVGGDDKEVIDLNRKAYMKLGCVKKMEIIPGAGHLFEEEGALEKVAELAGSWFEKHLGPKSFEEGISSHSQKQ